MQDILEIVIAKLILGHLRAFGFVIGKTEEEKLS